MLDSCDVAALPRHVHELVKNVQVVAAMQKTGYMADLMEKLNRFHAEFEELGPLGKGGFGSVVKVRCKFEYSPSLINSQDASTFGTPHPVFQILITSSPLIPSFINSLSHTHTHTHFLSSSSITQQRYSGTKPLR